MWQSGENSARTEGCNSSKTDVPQVVHSPQWTTPHIQPLLTGTHPPRTFPRPSIQESEMAAQKRSMPRSKNKSRVKKPSRSRRLKAKLKSKEKRRQKRLGNG